MLLQETEATAFLDNEQSALKSKGWTHDMAVLNDPFYTTHTLFSLAIIYKYLTLSGKFFFTVY